MQIKHVKNGSNDHILHSIKELLYAFVRFVFVGITTKDRRNSLVLILVGFVLTKLTEEVNLLSTLGAILMLPGLLVALANFLALLAVLVLGRKTPQPVVVEYNTAEDLYN